MCQQRIIEGCPPDLEVCLVLNLPVIDAILPRKVEDSAISGGR
jgi:hypothetical protein